MSRRSLIITCSASSVIILFLTLAIGGIILGFKFRSSQIPEERELFQGVNYEREVYQSPRSMVVHIVRVDLHANGIRTLITPGEPKDDLPLKARTTSQFLDEFNVQIAINGDGFNPWHSNTILNYYPHVGDPVDTIGFAASNGTVYSHDTDNEPTIYISPANRSRINLQIGRIHNAISGNMLLVQNGNPLKVPHSDLGPRTAVALDKANRYLIIFIVDGRQPRYSKGIRLAELAEVIIDHGGYTAVNLDGGGSTTLVVEDADGAPKILNSPINFRIPGWERPVGNHLGIFAKPLNNSSE